MSEAFKMTESFQQAIKRICLKWRHEKINGYCEIVCLIERLQREERKRRFLESAMEKRRRAFPPFKIQ